MARIAMAAALKEVYFCGSIRAGRQDVDIYADIVEALSKHGCNVLTPFVADKNLTEAGSEHPGGDKGIHDRDVELLQRSKVVVAEVTVPSLGVGYEIGRAFAMDKPILCLFRPSDGKKLSAMIAGMDDCDVPEGGKRKVVSYSSVKELEAPLGEFLGKWL